MNSVELIEDLVELLESNPKGRPVRSRPIGKAVIVEMKAGASFVPLYTVCQGSVYRTRGMDSMGAYVGEISEMIGERARPVPQCEMIERRVEPRPKRSKPSFKTLVRRKGRR